MGFQCPHSMQKLYHNLRITESLAYDCHISYPAFSSRCCKLLEVVSEIVNWNLFSTSLMIARILSCATNGLKSARFLGEGGIGQEKTLG